MTLDLGQGYTVHALNMSVDDDYIAEVVGF